MPYRKVTPRTSRKKWYALVIPDTHVGYVADTPTYSLGCWDIAVQALAHLQDRLTHVIFLGDFGNWESLSHWSALRADQVYVEEDIALVNARLDDVEALTKPAGIRVGFCEGNHEAWATQFEAKYPAMRNAVNLRKRLGFHRRGWEWVRENHLLRLGDLYFTHGHVRGVRTPVDLIKAFGVSVMRGHTHQLKTESYRNLTGEHQAWDMGCLASIDPPPPYSRGALPDSWVHALATVQVRANGRFQVSPRRIMDESWTELEDGTEIVARPEWVERYYQQDQDIRQRLRDEYADRYYAPGGIVTDLEPHHGKVNQRTGEVSPVARARRARIVRTLPKHTGT